MLQQGVSYSLCFIDKGEIVGKSGLLVTGSQLSEGEEDAVDHGESGDHIRLCEFLVGAGHDEADDALEGHAQGERVPGADPVADKGAEDGPGDVEQVDDRVPPKHGREGRRIVAVDGFDNGRAVDAKRVHGEVVDEPNEGDDQQPRAVELGHEPVRDFHVGHAVAGELLGLLEAQAHHQEDEGEHDADTERGSPLGAVVAVLAGGGHDVGHKGAHDEAHVDGGVGEEDEPAVAGPGLELAAGLGTAHRAGWVFAAYANTDKEAPVVAKSIYPYICRGGGRVQNATLFQGPGKEGVGFAYL